jgi:hypothetical protein
MDHFRRALASAMIIFLIVTSAAAQEPCLLYQRGTVACPDYGAPAATAVPGPSMDGGVATAPNGASTMLFKGNVPPNGFMIRLFLNGAPYGGNVSNATVCFVNDNGAAAFGAGFYMLPDTSSTVVATFQTPFGYKPIGPVSIWCQNSGTYANATIYLAARGW